MHVRSTLFLAAALAAAAPAASLASGRNLVVINPTGQMHMTISGTKDYIDGDVGIFKGRIEIREGAFDILGRDFMLTALNLSFDGVDMEETSAGRLAFRHIGLQLRDSVSWWGVQGGERFYRILIRNDDVMKSGDPTFTLGALALVNSELRHYRIEDRVSQPITGKIDYETGTVTMTVVLRGPSVEAPWYAPWVDDVDSLFTITLTGSFVEVPDPSDPRSDPKAPGKVVTLRSMPPPKAR